MFRTRCRQIRLLAEAEGLDDGAVTLNVDILEVVQKGATLGDQLGQGAGSTIIFAVHLQMLRQVGNTVGEQSDLALGGTSVSVGLSVLSRDFLLLFRIQIHNTDTLSY